MPWLFKEIPVTAIPVLPSIQSTFASSTLLFSDVDLENQAPRVTLGDTLRATGSLIANSHLLISDKILIHTYEIILIQFHRGVYCTSQSM